MSSNHVFVFRNTKRKTHASVLKCWITIFKSHKNEGFFLCLQPWFVYFLSKKWEKARFPSTRYVILKNTFWCHGKRSLECFILWVMASHFLIAHFLITTSVLSIMCVSQLLTFQTRQTKNLPHHSDFKWGIWKPAAVRFSMSVSVYVMLCSLR